MLRSVKEINGYNIAAKDGHLGRVKDFIFEEASWGIRWMVADTGNWLPDRKVLISPVTIGTPDWETQLITVQLTKHEIKSAPGLDADAPVSRQYEKEWFNHYELPYYWMGGGFWGMAPLPADIFTRSQKSETIKHSPELAAHVHRSTGEVTGYHIQAVDGQIGHVEDFIMDDSDWVVRYIVIDTRNWLPGRKVLVAASWVDSIDWEQSEVAIEMTKEVIKDSPEYDPALPVNREYEQRLYDYYGRPIYWVQPEH